MEPNVAKIYYMPPMSNRLNQIRWAQQLLESRGFKVKEIESRAMSSGDRRALEQGGHAYPVVYAHGRFISIDQLESELDSLQVPPSPKGTPVKKQDPPLDFLIGASPPGPQNIFLPVPDFQEDSSAPRRFVPVEESADDALDEVFVHSPKKPVSFGHFDVDPSPFGEDNLQSPMLEEIDDDGLEIHDLMGAATHFPIAAPSAPPATSSAPSLPQATSSGTGVSKPPQPAPSHADDAHNVKNTKISEKEPSAETAPVKDLRTQRLIWLFDGIKHYCESADFKRAVNLLGKTADLVETQARSIWSYFGWGSSAQSSTNSNNASAPNAPSGSQGSSQLPNPPQDSETTLTLLAVRKNWYGRDQYRFVRFEANGFVRLRPDNLEECERVLYEQLVAVQVTGPTLKLRYHQGEALTEISYNFGDAEVTRMIAEAFTFLKGKGTVAVSYVGM